MIRKNNEVLEKKLHELFGYDHFRPLQEEIITDCLQGKNVIALLPTGAGKSICYQLPARIQNGLTIVISPLLSLMEDQINELLLFGEKKAVALNSMRTFEERTDVYKNLHLYKLLFVSPEMLQSEKLLNTLKKCHINRLVIDEAHCITQWGHEFRRDYRKLGSIRELLGNPPVLALTATASKETLDDIRDVLQINEPTYHLQSMNRPNIALSVKEVSNDKEKIDELFRFVSKLSGNGIIYCNSRAMTEGLFSYLHNSGINDCAFYHGGISSEQRLLLQNQFREGQIRILIATSAFGMGINKKDIRFVIHYGVPPFLENYLQEIGRAGRDGAPSLAHLIFTEQDFSYSYSLVERELPTNKAVLQIMQVIQSISVKSSIWDEEWVATFLQTHGISEIHWRYVISLLTEFGVIVNKEIVSYDIQAIYKRFVEVRKERIYNKSIEVEKMIAVLKQKKCIRQHSLSFFGEQLQSLPSNCCSVCSIDYEEYFGSTEGKKIEVSWEEKLRQLLHL